MKTTELKNLIKEAVREVLKEELAELGKQKINESLSMGRPYAPVTANSTEEWPTINLNTANTYPAFKQSLMDSMGMTPPPAAPTTAAGTQNVYQNMLAQVAAEMRNNPAEINNFKNIS
jgi:hypothetical protein